MAVILQLFSGMFTILDECDVPAFNDGKWWAKKSKRDSRTFHVRGRVNGKWWMFHRYILREELSKYPVSYQIDHINGDALDNRRCNLRIVTQRQNQCNVALKKKWGKHPSKYKGVYWVEKLQKWKCEIRHKDQLTGKYVTDFYKLCNTEVEAALMYNDQAQLLYGEYALLNEVVVN